MEAVNLPVFPDKGDRQSLDQLWLAKLHSEGTAALLPRSSEIPRQLQSAIAQFNDEQYWDCHETLEQIWLSEEYPLRLFYHGLIKAAVGMLHLYRRNCRGAKAKLSDAVDTLAPFVPAMMGVDVAQLHKDLSERLANLQSVPEGDQIEDWIGIEGLPQLLIRHC